MSGMIKCIPLPAIAVQSVDPEGGPAISAHHLSVHGGHALDGAAAVPAV